MSFRSILGHSNHRQSPEPLAWQRFVNSLIFANLTRLDYSWPQKCPPNAVHRVKMLPPDTMGDIVSGGPKNGSKRPQSGHSERETVLMSQIATSNVGQASSLSLPHNRKPPTIISTRSVRKG